MTTSRTLLAAAAASACALLLWDAPAAARKKKQDKPKGAEVIKQGKVQVVRGLSGGEPQLTDRADKRWLITGPLRGEAMRLHGHQLKVWAIPGPKKMMVPTLAVKRYVITSSGGRKPVVGRLSRKAKRTFVLVRDKKSDLDIRSTNKRFLRRLAARVGCKVWMLGELEGTTLKAYKFGWINCKPPKVIKPRKESK